MNEVNISVGVLTADKISFRLAGNYHCGSDVFSGDFQATGKEKLVQLGFNESAEFLFTPDENDCYFELKDVVIGIGFHWERKENQRFTGALKLTMIDGRLTAINILPVEEYLCSVISSEMSATSSEELLKAHAIISRSWLLKPILHPEAENEPPPAVSSDTLIRWYERDAHVHFDVCADDHCQRYQGITRVSSLVVQKAVHATRGMVLTHQNTICDARYYKCCGGATELFSSCWADKDYTYLAPVFDAPHAVNAEPALMDEKSAAEWILSSPDAFCNTTNETVLKQVLNDYDTETPDFYRWKVVYTPQELSSLLKRKSGIDFGEIIDVVPLKRGPSGRIIQLKITGTHREITVGKELEIRKWFSESHLYSSAFVVQKVKNKNGHLEFFELTGAGWGHGVGLCQIGAAMMSENGYTYHQILTHYFKHVEIKKIY